MERTKLGLSKDKMYKALGEGERTSKKVSSIRMSDGSTFKRKNANQYGTAEGGNDYTEKRSNRTDRFDLGGTADSSNSGANMGGTMGSSIMKDGGEVDVYYQADYYDKQGGHDSLNGYSSNFETEYRKAMGLYTREKKAGELGKSTGYIGVSGSGKEFAILYLDKNYFDNVSENYFNTKSDYDVWMKVAKSVLDTGKAKKGSYNMMKKGGGVEDISKSLYVEKFYDKDGNFMGYTIKDKFNVSGNYTLSSKKERTEENRQYLIDNPSRLAYYRKNEYKTGGNLIGKQKNLDLNKNGKLDSEDFKMIRGNKKANGGGLANTPESFPNNDAVSYKTGGGVGKHIVNGFGTLKNGTRVYIGEGSQKYPNNDGVGVEGIYYDVTYQDGKEKLINSDEIVFPIKDKMSEGGSTKGFEYTIGGL